MRPTERIPLDALAEIVELKRDLEDLKTTTLKRIHDLSFAASVFNLTPWTSYTPVLTAATTDPTLGTGSTQEGRYMINSGLVIARFKIRFGSSGAAAGSGEYRVSLPVNASSDTPTTFTLEGFGVLYDWSVGSRRELCGWKYATATYVTGDVKDASIFDNAPWTWANDDYITGTFIYQEA